MKLGVVIPVGLGREENINLMLEYLGRCRIDALMLVLDGPDVSMPHVPPRLDPAYVVSIARHQPGREQPRNVGVRLLLERRPDITHVWFLDSDILVTPDSAVQMRLAARESPEAILIGPYEWMPPGQRGVLPELHNDPRWEMFNETGRKRMVAKLHVALGCFSGNLVWPVEAFTRIGGFHQELHHGRAEDGELGLRAASHQVPMMLVSEARGYHLWHEENVALKIERNARDVPLLNEWHPWVQERGLILTTQDGARFDYRCSECGLVINTLEMWEHAASHNQRDPASTWPSR